jgi:hypothetical protein
MGSKLAGFSVGFLLYPEDGDDIFFRNVWFLLNYSPLLIT